MTTARWPASARYGVLDSAPGELGFVQDLLNTASMGKTRQPDLLESLETAELWLRSSLAELARVDRNAPVPFPLDARGLGRLRSLRETLRAALAAAHSDKPSTTIDVPMAETTAVISLKNDGMTLSLRGKGIEGVRSYVLIQLVTATYADRMRRLKVCANPRCRGAFYDRSKNCSRLWHDVTTCGNAQNVKAYRARLKERKPSPSINSAPHPSAP